MSAVCCLLSVVWCVMPVCRTLTSNYETIKWVRYLTRAGLFRSCLAVIFLPFWCVFHFPSNFTLSYFYFDKLFTREVIPGPNYTWVPTSYFFFIVAHRLNNVLNTASLSHFLSFSLSSLSLGPFSLVQGQLRAARDRARHPMRSNISYIFSVMCIYVCLS